MFLIPSVSTLILAIKILVPSFILYLSGVAVYNRYFHPLRHFPGPFWGSITPLWYFGALRYGISERSQLPLHKKYGPFVRVTPNDISISDPDAIDVIYAPHNGKVFPKGKFYDGFNPHIGGRPDGFCERDDIRHAERRRLIAPLYTQGAILSYEPCFDRVIQLFYNRMESFVDSGETIDMGIWLRKYTFDIIGELYYGREGGFGFIRDNIDYKGWIRVMEVMPKAASAINYLPYGLRTMYLASQMLYAESREGLRGFFRVIDDAHAATKERLDIMDQGKEYNQNDVLSKLIGIVHEKGEKHNFTMLDVTTELWAVIWAGADTTASALTSIFYHLHKSPTKLEKLLAEIEEAFEKGSLSYPLRYNDAIKLPYLHAVVLEAMRMHSSLGTGLPRVVPPEGADICGRWIPGGTEVIMNANVVNFDKGVYGEDSEEFIPERWIRDGERVAANMERHMLQFGYGPRICIGRHITNTEMYKLLPTMLREFNFELMTPEWTIWAGWFQQQKHVDVKVTRRRPRTADKPQLVKKY